MPDSESITRTCVKCGATQPIEQFPLTRGKRYYRCKAWLKSYLNAWCAANRERSRAIKDAYLKRHPERKAESLRKYYHDGNGKRVYAEYKEKNKDRINERYREQYAEDKTPFLIRAQRRTERDNAVTGKFRQRDRARLFEEQGGRCANPYCGAVITLAGSHADHKTPVILGGSHDPSNRQLLCPKCNHRKGTLTNEAWLLQQKEIGMTPQKRVSPDQPWLMPEVIDWLNGILKRDMTVLETSAGGSTVFFAYRVKRVITYEHDRKWAGNVQLMLDTRALDWKASIRLSAGYPQEGLAIGEPLDLAFIDGRGRVKSSIDAWQHLKPGGWLVLDDSRRERYAPVGVLLDPVCSARIEFRAAPWEPEQSTTAWRKR